MKKECKKCASVKDVSEYHKDKRKSDGLSPWCKVCKNQHRSAAIKKERQDKDSPASKRRRVHRLVAQAVKKGTLVKPDKCEQCDQLKMREDIEGHHADYDKVYDVEWLCRSCHTSRHVADREANLTMCPICDTKRVKMSNKTCGDLGCVKQAQVRGGKESVSSLKGKARETAERVAKDMEENGWSRTEVALLMGVSVAYVSQVLNENGFRADVDAAETK
ncbi:helix-turn-helix transcriptional regulator [Candidatus Babeliales bacterium]|nr:helix-turn-helix transcriptional regulator [Candidatus Babeliales bacterium]